MIDELQKEARMFESKISKSLQIISPTNLTRKSFDMDNEPGFDAKSFESFPFFNGPSKIDEKFSRCLECIKNLKRDLKHSNEENKEFKRKIEELSSSKKLLTLENEVFVRERTFYTDQMARIDEKNNQIRKDCEKRLETQAQEFKKEINSLREVLNQKQNINDINFERQKSIMQSSILVNNRSTSQMAQSIVPDQTLLKKISLLEVF
jgi:hypothetical protein